MYLDESKLGQWGGASLYDGWQRHFPSLSRHTKRTANGKVTRLVQVRDIRGRKDALVRLHNIRHRATSEILKWSYACRADLKLVSAGAPNSVIIEPAVEWAEREVLERYEWMEQKGTVRQARYAS